MVLKLVRTQFPGLINAIILIPEVKVQQYRNLEGDPLKIATIIIDTMENQQGER